MNQVYDLRERSVEFALQLHTVRAEPAEKERMYKMSVYMRSLIDDWTRLLLDSRSVSDESWRIFVLERAGLGDDVPDSAS